MIRKKWTGDELVLSVETEDEFWKAATTGEPVELTHELAEKIGLMEEDVASGKNIVQMFRRKVLRELKKIKIAWPGLNYSTAPGVLILHPSTPAIAPLNQGQLTS